MRWRALLLVIAASLMTMASASAQQQRLPRRTPPDPISADAPASFKKDLAKLGLKAHSVDISEFYKAGGGIRCLINTLE